MTAQRVVAKRRDQREPWEQPLRHPPVVRVRLAVAPAVQRQAEGVVLDLEDHVAVGLDVFIGLRALMHRIVVDLVAVHVGDVAGVDAAFHRLKVVAFLQPLRDKHVAVGQRAPFDLRRRRLLLLRPHIGPHDAGALDAWVSLDAHGLARLRRRRHIDALAVARELQPVIGATNAVLFIAAEEQRGAAMRAELVDQANLAVGVTKRQELFAEDLNPHLRSVRPAISRDNRSAPNSAASDCPSACQVRCERAFPPFPCSCENDLLASLSVR